MGTLEQRVVLVCFAVLLVAAKCAQLRIQSGDFTKGGSTMNQEDSMVVLASVLDISCGFGINILVVALLA